jgi:hypothetical protein
MADAHTAAKSLLLAAVRDASVASAAGVVSGWANRVLTGDKDGFVHSLHRGLLPAVEVFQTGDTWTNASAGDGGQGITRARWVLRVHSGVPDQNLAEEQCRAIAYASLIKIREQPYFTVGDDALQTFQESPLGYSMEIEIDVTTSMGRDTYETTPSGTSGPVPDGGAVGGISTDINFNTTSPVSVLALPIGQALARIELKVKTDFDGGAPTITVGIDGDQSRYLAADDSDLKHVDSVWMKDISDAGPRTVKVWIEPDGSTQGQVNIQLIAVAAA